MTTATTPPCTMLGCRELGTTTDVHSAHVSCPRHSGRPLCQHDACDPEWGGHRELATHEASDGAKLCDVCTEFEIENGDAAPTPLEPGARA